jgi:hypothetical protein
MEAIGHFVLRMRAERLTFEGQELNSTPKHPRRLRVSIHPATQEVSGIFLFGGGIKLKVKFTLSQATKAQRWSRCTALLFL